MKTNKITLFILLAAFALVSCQPETEKVQTVINFEDVALDDNGLSSDTFFVSTGFNFYGDPNQF